MTDAFSLRRVVLGVSRHHIDESTAHTAVTFAGRLGLDLLGLFSDEKDLIALADLPFARELRSLEGSWMTIDAGRLAAEGVLAARHTERRLRDIAARSRARLIFATFRGSPSEAIASLSHAGDIVVIATSRDSSQLAVQSAISLAESALGSSASVMFVPSRLARARVRGPVVAMADHPAQSSITLGKSAMSAELVIVNTGDFLESEWERPISTLPSSIPVRFIRSQMHLDTPARQPSLPMELRYMGEWLLVASRSILDASSAAIIAVDRNVPVLLVKSADVPAKNPT
jgi:hypothetical protein